MSSRGDQSDPSATLQTPRATRISEAEWNARHHKLEKLYIDDDSSLQEIKEIMAREDDFLVTEKQLKYRFNKWGLKKYVSDRDLTTMLSFKRKRLEQGKHTGFEYRGHLFEEERLERASKRRKGSLMPSPVLSPYIVALVSPRQGPRTDRISSGHDQTSAPPRDVAEVVTNIGGATGPRSPFNNFYLQPGDFGFSEFANSLDPLSSLASVDESGKTQSNSEWWETLLDDSSVTFSPRHISAMLSPQGQDSNTTRIELRRQLSSSTPNVCAARVGNENEVTLLDMDLDFDFSMFESPPDGPSAAPSASFHIHPNAHESGEMMSISPLQLADDNGTHSRDRNINRVSGSTTAEGQALGRVTAQDVRAESIASLLMMLKSYILPSFDIVSQQYEYGNSVITKFFCPHLCEWLCSEYEALLDIYLERTLMSNRKRRTARVSGSLLLGSNAYIDEPEEDLELTLGAQRVSNTTERRVEKLRSVFYSLYRTPGGDVLFEVKEESGGLVEDVESHSDSQIIIKLLPQAMERTPGLCVRFNKLINKPGISPHINTFNVIPYNSAIFGCVKSNDLKGVQSLFDQGAASARDVDPRGRSLLNYAIFTGGSDLFRLLLQGGASLYALGIYCNRTTDIITTIWTLSILNAQDYNHFNEAVPPSTSRVVKFDERVAMTQLALDNDCNIYEADNMVLSSGPLFQGFDHRYINDFGSSDLRDMIQYLTSIGYDLEDWNEMGQTPLLWAAAKYYPATAKQLSLLIESGASLDATDDFGLGLLHTVLLGYLSLIVWENGQYSMEKFEAYGYLYPICLSELHEMSDERELYWELNWLVRQDHQDELCGGECVVEPLTGPRSTSGCQSTPCRTVAGPDVENSCLNDPQRSQDAMEQSLPSVASNSKLESDAAFTAGESVLQIEQVDAYVIARDEYGIEHRIRNPIPVLKARVAIKLKILLEAGCDPNVVDSNGLSPTDYAKPGEWSREGLWSQWTWALRVTGHTFDAVRDRWIKQSTPAS